MEKSLIISNEELKSYGCASCFWKANNQCEFGLKDNEVLPKSICEDYAKFLIGLARGSQSINVMLENFNLHVAQMQQSADYAEMKKLEREIADLQKEGSQDRDRIKFLADKKFALRMFWQKMNFDLIKGYSRTNDRDARVENPSIHVDKISLTQIHKIVNNTKKELEHKE